MKNFILRWTVYLPFNIKILLTKLFVKRNKNSYITNSFYFIPKKKKEPLVSKVNIKCNYVPERKTEGAAAYDLIANINESFLLFRAGDVHLVPTGFSLEIPKGKCGLLFIRSGLASKTPLTLANGVGLIDSDYRGEILVPIRNTSQTKRASINKGERIAQLLLIDCFTPQLQQVKQLSDTKRNNGGFGSTGAK
jgi:dUTP pyrophosphatase